MAGLNVPTPVLQKTMKFLDHVETEFKMQHDGKPKTYVSYGYTGPGNRPATTAVGLLCRQYLGWSPKNAKLAGGVDWLTDKYPPRDASNMYYYYYATQVMHHMGGEHWDKWNPRMRDLLIATQDKGTRPFANVHSQKGTWDPTGDHIGGRGGRVMQTSLSALTLEVYYRHLPLYRREMTGAKDL
jgi:hypothetical protein